MIKIVFRLIFIVLIISLITDEAEAQLRLKVRKVFDKVLYTSDPWQYPVIKARIRADRSGTNVKLNANQILILENNKVSKPFYVGDYETDTTTGELWQLIKWYTRREGYNIPINNVSFMIDTIIAFDKNEIAKVMTFHNRKDMSYVKLHDYKESPIIEIEYKQGSVGSSQNQNLVLKAMVGMIDGSGSEGQIWIDSVSLDSKHFRYKWDGNWDLPDQRPPPLHIWPSKSYFVRLYYEPKDDEYHTGKFSVYYDHGLKQDVMLIGHEYHIPAESNNLKLLYPNGGEALTPCQDIKIEWEGYVRGFLTYIDFSSNGGSAWENIGKSDTSFFYWNVPNVSTKKGLLRIRQNFNNTKPVALKIDNSPVYKLSFNYDGSRLLSASSSGIIASWNTSTEKEDKRYYIDSPDLYPGLKFIQTGMSYISGDSIFCASYYRSSDYPRKDSIAFFRANDSIPYLRVGIDVGFETAKVVFDSQKELMAFIPELGTQVKIYSAKTGSFVKDLFFSNPVSAFSFSRDENLAAVALWNGIIQIYSLPNFNVVNELDYSDFPVILSLSLAPNGKFLALGCKSSQRTQFSDERTDVFIVDINTKQVIRRMRKITADPIGLEFSPKSTKLLIGVKRDRQIAYWDLPVDDIYNNFDDHDGNLTDFVFSPLGSMIASSADSRDNIQLRRFSYAEADETDGRFEILTPNLTVDEIKIPDQFLAENKNYKFEQAICVNADSPVHLQVDKLTLKQGKHITLIDPIPQDTIINPGECLSVSLNYYPLDTGRIADTIFIHSCGRIFTIPLLSNGIPLESRSIPRNIVFLLPEIEFEETCIGTEVIREFPLAINADPVPLMVNGIDIIKSDYTPFFCLTNRDLTYLPGDTIFATISYKPYELRDGLNDLVIYHSNQTKYTETIEVKGKAIGTDYDLSHYDLRFIPEILIRKIKVINKSANEIFMEKATINLPEHFTLLTGLPKTIKPNSSEDLEIRWNIENGEPPNNVYIELVAGPCAAEKYVTLGLYESESQIIVPNVFADPRGTATINIDFKNSVNSPYNGERFFEGELIINPRFFLPQSVTSPFGTGTLTKNTVIEKTATDTIDRRLIGFRIEGNIPEEGRVAEIHGIAGLAEIDTSHINLVKNAKWWGVSAKTYLGYGVFQLVNICGDRLVIHNNQIKNLLASPNPSDGTLNLSFESLEKGECKIEIYNAVGINEFESNLFIVNKGTNQLKLDIGILKSGLYNLMMKQGSGFASIRILIVK